MPNTMGNLMLWIQRNSTESTQKYPSPEPWSSGESDPFILDLERIPIPVIMLNKQGVILKANRSFQEFYGLNYAELTGANFTILFENYSLSDFLKIHSLSAQQPYIQQESAITTGYGETRWVQLHFNRLDLEQKDTLLLTITDITPLRTQAEKISREYEQIKLLADAVMDGIVVLNSYGFVEWQNRRSQQLLGYKDHELVGQSFTKFLPSLKIDQMKYHPEKGNGNSNNPKSVYSVDIEAKAKNGNQIPVKVWERQKRLQHRTIRIFIIRDMTAIQELEPDLLQLREQFLKEIGQDLHDSIGGMLSGITLIGEQLVRQLKSSNHPINEKLEEVIDLIKETDELTHLLAKGMMREGQLAQGLPHSLERLCNRVSKLFHVTCVYCGLEKDKILGNEVAEQLYSVAEEAIGNAIRHGRASDIRVSFQVCEEFLILQIEDNGIGFPKSQNQKVETHTSKKTYGGLGLSIMRKRAMKLGGELIIQRNRNRKTSVRCVIPLQNLEYTPPKQDTSESIIMEQ